MTAILNQHENYLQADQAYGFPLLIKNLLSRAKVVSGDKKIHYAEKPVTRIMSFSNVSIA